MTDKLKHLVSNKKIDFSSSKFKATLIDSTYMPKNGIDGDVTWEASSELIHSPPIIIDISQLKG